MDAARNSRVTVMLSAPKIGDCAQVWYGSKWRRVCGQLHGRIGVVRVVSKGSPRNHGVEIEGRLIVVPRGHLRKTP
jgi:hypothetical protein